MGNNSPKFFSVFVDSTSYVIRALAYVLVERLCVCGRHRYLCHSFLEGATDRRTPVNSKDRAREGRPCYVTVTLTTSDKLSNRSRIVSV